MSWTRITSTGSGSLALRLAIDGFPYQAVTHSAMEMTASDGRIRYVGLGAGDVKLSQKADLLRSDLETTGAGFTFTDVNQRWTRAFNLAPTATSWLSINASSVQTTIDVKSTAAFASSGYLFLNSEVIQYTGKLATQFLSCVRGRWGTLAQSHYIPDGAGLRYPEITNGPTVLQGRRVRLYAYGEGDDPQGDGEQIWLGVVSGEPRMSGPEWSLSVDPITSILDSKVAGDLGEPGTVRGIYYNWRSPWMMSGYNLDLATTFSVQVPNATCDGFFENQQEFIQYINGQLAAGTVGWLKTIRLQEDEVGSYEIVFQQGATTERSGLSFLTTPPCDPQFSTTNLAEEGFGFHWEERGAGTWQQTGTSSTVLLPANKLFTMWRADGDAGLGQVPRGVYSGPLGIGRGATTQFARFATNAPDDKIYLAGSVATTSNVSSVAISWGDDEINYAVEATSSSERSVRVIPLTGRGPGARPFYAYYPGNLPEIRLARYYGSPSLVGTGTYALMRSISDDCATQLNMGAVPYIRLGALGDWDDVAWLAAYTGVTDYARNRFYNSTQPATLRELICPDLQLANLYLAIDSTGRLTVKRLRLATPTESSVVQITSANLLTDEGMPTYERGSVGTLNTITLHDGYDPKTDKYTNPTITIRDIAAFGRTGAVRGIDIKPKSTEQVPATANDVLAISGPLLGIFGSPYAYVHCDVPLSCFSALLGTTVSITTEQLPSSAGTRGVTSLNGIVIERSVDLYAARISLTILATPRTIAGYAPCGLISSQANVVLNKWTLTMSTTSLASGETWATHLVAGDGIMIYRYDSNTAGIIGGYVDSVVANTVTVVLNSPWTPSTDEWFFSFDYSDSGTINTRQAQYAYVAGPDGVIDFDTADDASAFVLAP